MSPASLILADYGHQTTGVGSGLVLASWSWVAAGNSLVKPWSLQVLSDGLQLKHFLQKVKCSSGLGEVDGLVCARRQSDQCAKPSSVAVKWDLASSLCVSRKTNLLHDFCMRLKGSSLAVCSCPAPLPCAQGFSIALVLTRSCLFGRRELSHGVRKESPVNCGKNRPAHHWHPTTRH